VIDVLGPAESYWAGLPTVLAQKGIDRSRVAVAHAPTGFGERTAAGAVAALEKVGFSPVAVSTFDDGSASALASALIALEASAVIACGHIEDDLALMESLPSGSMAVGSIVAGIDLARERLGDRVLGCFGPAQWFPTHEHPLAQDAQYPAAQAYAAGEVAQAAAAAAESFDPDRLWNAAIGLRMRTLIGPFEVEEDGKQRAHSPLLVEWAQTSEGPKRRVIWQP
jgi:branched-chain amino acid transport system substrate-binding protein